MSAHPIPPDVLLAAKLETETEWNPSVASIRDAILRRFTERLDAVAAKHPDQLGRAIAVIIQAGPGRTVLVISDPAAGDLVKELERYADWKRCDWSSAEQYRSRILTGSIGLEGAWSEWIDGRPEKTAMNREYEYRTHSQSPLAELLQARLPI